MGNFISGKSKENTNVAAHRRVYVGSIPEIVDENDSPGHGRSKKKIKFADNRIVTSRYTFLTFVPKTIFEQFHRFVNIYFLCVVLLQGLSDSPVSPASTGAAFAFVLAASILKQAYEDWLRHKSDAILNNMKVNIVKDGKVQELKSKDIKVGDILRLRNDEPVPADLLVLTTSDQFLRCQITTVNLDGETNYKVRNCPSGLQHYKSAENFIKFASIIECDEPNSNLYTFNGSLFLPKSVVILSQNQRRGTASSSINHRNSIDEENATAFNFSTSEIKIKNETFVQIPLAMENILLRGTTLKNTEIVYGLVIYTGQDTRLSQNSKKTHTKFSTVERSINTFLVAIIIILIILISICTGAYFIMKDDPVLDANNAGYLYPNQENTFGHFFHIFSSFFVLFNYIIPISLYVTIELQKFFGSKFFVWDEDMICPKTGQAPICNTSDLNEELGQIEYLFSDKTGTLTENIMQFKYCSINGKRYELKQDGKLWSQNNDAEDNAINVKDEVEVRKFMKVLALCHTVQIVATNNNTHNSSNSNIKNNNMEESQINLKNNWEYQASSPDEKSLLDASYRLGVKFTVENDDDLYLQNCDEEQKYKRLMVLEFDSDRKCMSVIVEDEQDEIWLYSKGAESVIIPKCISGPKLETLAHVDEFACLGMRTLAIAEKKLSKQEFNTFLTELNSARRLLIGRDEKIRNIYNTIESNLNVIGATGVEDQLQDHVKETLEALAKAGIKVWMLTGDKLETAMNVAVSCGLMKSDLTKRIVISNCTNEETVSKYLESTLHLEDFDDICCVLDGQALAFAIKTCPDLLTKCIMKVGRVVCCRMAPLQKAQVVKLVKSSQCHPITAAVGDGANDVAMIQEAHIGLGIMGKEGRQAARCSDFALARFSFLKKAILVHGHWYYARLTMLVLFFFYKNIVFILPPAFAAMFSAFSSQTLFNPFFLTTFNIFYSSAPILAIGLSEQPISVTKLLSNPELYKTLSKNRFMSWGKFFSWMFHAIWHSLLVFFIPVLAWSSFSPLFNDWACFGMFIMCAVVALTNVKLLTETKYNNFWVFFTYGISFCSFFLFTTIYAEVDLKGVLRPRELRHAFWTIQSHPSFWFTMVLITGLGLFPDLAWKCFSATWNNYSSDKNVVRKPFV